MADPRFFTNQGPFTLAQLAEKTGAVLQGGNGGAAIEDVSPLETAGSNHISFLENPKYVPAFEASKAGACFVNEKYAPRAPKGMALLVSDAPYLAYAKAAQLFYPTTFEPFISPHAFIGNGVQIGKRCRIEPGVVLHTGVVIGDDCYIGANTTISHAIIGDRVIIHRGVHIGQDGFGFAPSPTGIIKVPQLGRVIIGNDVEIGSGTCIDRGAGPDTTIGDFAKIDNLVMIAHNCQIGRGAIIVGQVGLAGSTKVGDFVQLGGQAGVAGHLNIGKGAKVAARSGVMNDIPPGETWGGAPAIPLKEFFRQVATLAALASKKTSE